MRKGYKLLKKKEKQRINNSVICNLYIFFILTDILIKHQADTTLHSSNKNQVLNTAILLYSIILFTVLIIYTTSFLMYLIGWSIDYSFNWTLW